MLLWTGLACLGALWLGGGVAEAAVAWRGDWGSVVDNSSNAYISRRYCGLDEACKSAYDSAFACACLPQYACTGRGPRAEAVCSLTVGLGYVWEQPALEEGLLLMDIRPTQGEGLA